MSVSSKVGIPCFPMRTAGDAFLCAIVCAACARNGALSRLGCAVLPETMIFSCTARLHASPRGHALRACVVSRLGNMAYGWMKGDLAPNRMSTPPAVCTAPSRARVRVHARLSQFSIFSFTSSPVCGNFLIQRKIGVKALWENGVISFTSCAFLRSSPLIFREVWWRGV